MTKQKPLYTDRDYLEGQFRDVFKALDNLSNEFKEVKKKVIGNGERGLIDITEDNREHISFLIKWSFIISAFLVITHLKQTADFIVINAEKLFGH